MDKESSDFIALVAMMRGAQKIYFRIRTTEALQESKRLEKEVDEAVKELTLKYLQPTLF